MNAQDDQEWLDALAGREHADSAAAREARNLRAAVRARTVSDVSEIAAEDATREASLIARAEREGLISHSPPQLSVDKERHDARRQWPRLAAAAAIACFAIGLAWLAYRPVELDTVRGPDEIVRVESENPLALKERLIDELRRTGVDAVGYEMLGRHGIDADLPQPIPAAVRQVLARYGIPVPADGVLRVEIVAPE